MFELSGVNYEEVLEQGDSILVRVIASSSYREFELSGVRVIGGSSYRGFELSGLYCTCCTEDVIYSNPVLYRLHG